MFLGGEKGILAWTSHKEVIKTRELKRSFGWGTVRGRGQQDRGEDIGDAKVTGMG